MQRAFDTFMVCYVCGPVTTESNFIQIPHDIMPREVVTEKEGLRVKCEFLEPVIG